MREAVAALVFGFAVGLLFGYEAGRASAFREMQSVWQRLLDGLRRKGDTP